MLDLQRSSIDTALWVIHEDTSAELVHQIISGDTPPMPSFQIEPQSMADLIAYLHKIS